MEGKEDKETLLGFFLKMMVLCGLLLSGVYWQQQRQVRAAASVTIPKSAPYADEEITSPPSTIEIARHTMKNP